MRIAEARLRTEVACALQERTGLTGTAAAPFIEAVLDRLQEVYGGQNLYIPVRTRKHDKAAIERDLRGGVPQVKVCRMHGLSRSTLALLFPGGLPKPEGRI